MADFPTLSYASTREIPTLSYIYLKPKNGIPFPHIGHHREYPSPQGNIIPQHSKYLNSNASFLLDYSDGLKDFQR